MARPVERIVLVALTAVVVGGVAYASIPDSGGVIHGCYTSAGGALRVIDTAKGQACKPSERAIQWNQTGPQGPPGPAGSGAGIVGHYQTLAYGAIDTGDPPLLLMTVPGFGEVHITRCSSAGETALAFKNTSGQVIKEFFTHTEINPGATVDYADPDPNYTTLQNLMSIGEGPTSKVAQIGVNAHIDPTAQTCAFHGIGF